MEKTVITLEYLNEQLNEALDKYAKDEDIISFINDINEKNKKILPIALFYAQKIDIMKNLSGLESNFDTLVNFKDSMVKDLQGNKETIDNLGKIELFNNPQMQNVLEKMIEK